MVSIYPTSHGAALPERTRRQAEDRLEKAGVRYVLSSWIDILGSPKTKPVPGFGNLCKGKGSRFAADFLGKHVFGDAMHELFTIHKQDEWDRFHESITEWRKARISAFILSVPKLSVRDVGKRYDLGDGTTIEAVRDVSFDLQEGEICALLGPAGCGKSTVLRLVVGLEDPTTGAMFLNGKEIYGPDMREEMRDDTEPLALPH